VHKKWYAGQRADARSWRVYGRSSDLAATVEFGADDMCFGMISKSLAMHSRDRLSALLSFDFGGFECVVDDARRLMIFEANATMAVLKPDPETRWD
jgi:hypothetical protein